MSTAVSPSKQSNSVANSPIWRIFFTLFTILALGVVAFSTFRPIVVLPRITLSPGFALTDQTGAPISNEDFRGQIVLYNFTYAGCEAPCLQTGAVMAQVQSEVEKMETGGIPIKLVSISIDPERDTPAVLAAYGQRYGANPDLWHVATGSAVQLKSVIGGGFSVYYKHPQDGAGEIKLDPAFMLVDGNGILRAEYRTAVPDIDIIVRDMGLLVQEAHNSDGPARYAYEAAHLFLCYPR